MIKDIKIPRISEGVETATVSEIMVSKGDQIKEDQSIISLETDKATAEVPATASGSVKDIKISEGQEVHVGEVIMTVENDAEKEDDSETDQNTDEKRDSDTKEPQKKEEEKDKDQAEASEPKDKAESSESKQKYEKEKSVSEKKTTSSSDVYASPGVRRLARELGVDIKDLKGSGESGRITEKDVKKYQSGETKQPASALEQLPDFSQWGPVERKALNTIKKITAKNVTASWQSIPHVFQFGEADISNIEGYIEKHKDDIEETGGKLTLTSILTKIVASALHQFPIFNASIDMEHKEMILKKYININIAVATDKGLLVPVVRNVDQKTMKELSVEISEVAKKARNQELSNKDMEGGNFSISNLGGIGGTNFTPIVYHPQVAILGISRATKKPVYVEGEFKARTVLPLSLSYDHRLIDGADGAAFMDWIVKALENPYEALLS